VTVSFGTDGIRGVANTEVTAEIAAALGRAAARVLPRDEAPWLIGRDTRASGPMLVAALAEGLTAAGADVVDLGVLPTPAVAYASERLNAPAAMVSASHNPWTDNGIKLLARGGRKLDDAVETEIADLLGNVTLAPRTDVAEPGRITFEADPLSAYVAHLANSLDGRTLDGLTVVVDCANGAASGVAARVLHAAGAEARVLFADPDGTNINRDCGSTHPAALQRAVVDEGADAGLALDGDADRVIAVDHTGALVDGDQIMAICAIDFRRRDRLRGDAIAVTVMSNLGLRRGLRAEGIELVETAVGDRYILAALDQHDLTLGGEQSGHVIFHDLATTGDGLLTGLQLLDVVARSGRSLADLAASAMTRLPQVLRNVRVDRGAERVASESVRAAVAAEQAALGDRGRVLLRPSGTEPLVRVMVEAETEALAEETVARLIKAVEGAALGGRPRQ
jgi:phosphoglucosamine mutase